MPDDSKTTEGRVVCLSQLCRSFSVSHSPFSHSISLTASHTHLIRPHQNSCSMGRISIKHTSRSCWQIYMHIIPKVLERTMVNSPEFHSKSCTHFWLSDLRRTYQSVTSSLTPQYIMSLLDSQLTVASFFVPVTMNNTVHIHYKVIVKLFKSKLC